MRKLLEFIGVLFFFAIAVAVVAACLVAVFWLLHILGLEYYGYAQMIGMVSALLASYFILRKLYRLLDEHLVNPGRPRLRRLR